MARDNRDMSRDTNCSAGDFGVHLFDRTAKLELVKIEGPIHWVRFSQDGELKPMLREECYFPWDAPKPKPIKKKRVERDEDEDEDEFDDK